GSYAVSWHGCTRGVDGVVVLPRPGRPLPHADEVRQLDECPLRADLDVLQDAVEVAGRDVLAGHRGSTKRGYAIGSPMPGGSGTLSLTAANRSACRRVRIP